MRKTFASIFIAAALAFASISAFAQGPGPGPGPQPIPNPWVVSGNTLSPNGKKVLTTASATSSAGFNLAPGVAPTSPVNGDIWTTSSALFARISGTTEQIAPIGVVTLVNGVSCALGGSCTISTTPAASITQGTTVVNGTCASGNAIYNAAGVIGCSTNLTISAINSIPVGATNPSTGAFTTLSGNSSAAYPFVFTQATGSISVIDGGTGLAAGSSNFPIIYEGGNSGGGLQVLGNSTAGASVQINNWLNSGTGNTLTFGFLGGTPSSPTAVGASAQLGRIQFAGFNGTGNPNLQASWNGMATSTSGASIQANSTQAFTGSNGGTQIVMSVTPNGSVASATAFTLDQDKTLNIVGGYKTNGSAGVTKTCGATIVATGGIITSC